MFLSQGDVDMLRLIRWCRYVSKSALEEAFSQEEVSNLLLFKLIRIHRTQDALLLTSNGNTLLDAHIPNLPSGAKPVYRQGDTLRRIRLSRLMLTAYRAGFQTFFTDPLDLALYTGFCLASTTRGRGVNSWGNSRTAGLTLLDSTLYAIHYVCPNIGKVNHAHELDLLSRQMFPLEARKRAFLFVGESYQEILEELEIEPPEVKRETGQIYYATANQRHIVPIHLLSCDKVGALQLMIMSQPDYRTRLARKALGVGYENPPPLIDCDALHSGIPVLVMVDMDLHRLEAACELGEVKVLALEDQAEAVLYARYRDTGRAKVFILHRLAIESLWGEAPQLYRPPAKNFETEKGEFIDAPFVAPRPKAIRANRKK